MSAAINSELNAVLVKFQNNVSGDAQGTEAYNSLMSAINLDPNLLNALNVNAASNALTTISWLPNSSVAEANGTDIQIGSNYLSNPGSVYAVDEVVSHENYHIGYAPTLDSQESSWDTEVGNYFGGALPLATPDTLLQQYQQLNAANEGGAFITGINGALISYMAANGLTSLTASNIQTLMKNNPDPALSNVFNSDGTLISGTGLVQSANGTFDFNQNISSASSFMATAVGSNGSVYNETWGSSALYSMCGSADGKPFSLNYAEDGLLQNGSNTTQPLTDMQADNLFIAQNGTVTQNTPSCTINDTGTGQTSTFQFLEPGAFGNGLETAPSTSILVSPTVPVPSTSPSTDYLRDVSLQGTDIYDIDTTTTNGIVAASISGSGAADDISNANIAVAPTAQAILTGNSNDITAGLGATTILQGNNNILTATGGTINAAAGDTGETFDSSGTTINAASGFEGAITGANNICYFLANTDCTLELSGTSNVVNSIGNAIQIFGASSSATVNGADTIGLNAANQTLTLSATGDTISTIANDTGESIAGSGLTLDSTGLFLGVITGTNNTCNLSASSGSTLGLSGTGNTAISVGNTIQVDGASSTATVDGANTVDLEAASQSLSLGTTGDTIATIAGDTGEAITGSGLTLDGTGLFSGVVTGANDIFNLAASSGSTLGLSGTGDVANSVGNTIQVDGASSTATVAGADTVDLEAANQKLTLSTTGDTVDTIASDTGEAITGSGLTLDGTGLFSGVVTGANDTFNLAASSGSTLGVSGTGDVANSIGNTIQVDGASSTATVAGADTVDLEAANQKLTLSTTGDTVDTIASDTGEAITGSGLTLDGTGLFSGVVTGANDTFNLAASSGSTLGVSGTSDVANSVSNTINLDSAGSSADVVGSGNTLGLESTGEWLTSGSGNTISTAANSIGDVLTCTGDTIDGGSGFTALLSGTGNTINLTANSGSGVELYGSGDTTNAVDDAVFLNAANLSDTVVGTGDKVGINASGDTLSLSSTGDTVDTAANSIGDLITGTSETIDGGSGFTGLISGTNNTINLTANSGSGALLYGSGDTTNAVDDAVFLNAASIDETVTGAGDKVYLNTAGDQLTLSTSGDTVDTAANATGEIVAGSGETINGASDYTGYIMGSNDTANLTSSSGSSIAFFGQNDVANSVGNNLYLAQAGDSGTVIGSGNTISLNASTQVLTADSADDTVHFAAGATGDTLDGSGASVDAYAAGTFNINGNNDTFTNGSSTIDSITGLNYSGTGSTFNLESGSTVSELGAGSSATINSASTLVNLDASNQTASLDTTGDTVHFAGGATGDTLDGSGTSVDAYGTGNFNINGNNDTFTNGAVTGVNYTGTGSTFNLESDSTVSELGAGSSATINSGNSLVNLDASNQIASLFTTGDTVHFAGGATGDTLDGSGASVDAYATGNFNINGNNDTFTNGAVTGVDYTGTGSTFNLESDSTVSELGVGSSATINSGNSLVNLDASNQIASLFTTGDTVHFAEGVTGDTLDGSGASVDAYGTGTFDINGNNDTFTNGAADASVSISGQDDTIYQSNATVDIAGDDNVTIDGSNDKIMGGSSDTFTLDGTGDTIDATNSTATYDGSDTGDVLSGSGDTWTDPSQGTGGDGGDGGDGDGDGDGVGGDGDGDGSGFVSWKGRGPTASQIAKNSSPSQSSVYEHAVQANKVITWSLADTNEASQTSDRFSGYIDTPAEQAAVEQAFQAWSKASGLTFVEVPDSASSDIRLGFGDLNTATSNTIGLTSFSSTNGQMNPGVVVRMEDPSQAPLVTAANGQAMYADTGASFEQVALHEIGHALGLGDNSNPTSIMDYLLGPSNQSLSLTDIQGMQTLYGQGSASIPASPSSTGASNQLHQLIQAMASFDAGEGAADTSESYVQAMHHTASLASTLSSSYHVAHAA
jgi:predicted Zn-dependent protease